MKLGLISDTHGLVRPQALDALAGCELIVHAGDVGGPQVIRALEAVAPVVAVRGNNDWDPWGRAALRETEVVDAAGSLIYMLHDLHDLDLDPAVAGFAAVVCGHSHRPLLESRDGWLLLNPGSAGPRRFSLPVTVAVATVGAGRLDARIVHLGV